MQWANIRRCKKMLLRIMLWTSAGIVVAGYLIPEHFHDPVKGMNTTSFHHQSFWYYPWGASVRHKGVDIFAEKGTPVSSSTPGFVLYAGTHKRGGKMVLVLGPKWRIHHYLHLDTIMCKAYERVHAGTDIGKVGNTGNAANKPAHLHYAISTPLPYVWQAETGIQGWKKIWHVDPTPYLLHTKS